MRYAARVDTVQPDIVKGLRKIGAGVTSMARLGGGVSDLLVSFRQRWYVMEVKTDDGKLSTDQLRWIGEQKAPVYTVRSLDQAVDFLTRETPDWLLGLEVKAMREETHRCSDIAPAHRVGAGSDLHGSLQERVLEALRKSWRSGVKLSASTLYDMLGASRAAKNVERVLRRLCDEQLAHREGNNRNAMYWAEEPK